MDAYETYLEAERRINEGLIRVGRSLEARQGYGPHPEGRLESMRALLAKLGNPQDAFPAVHVVGTSGKGTVCAAIAAILSEAGLRVGLHVSPYLQAMTEKIQIAGRFVAAEELAAIAASVLPLAEPLVREDAPASVHGMASVAIAFEAFRRARVDVAIVEAGCGARYDLTSAAGTEVAVLTNVGADHLDVLGPTLAEVAWHKAGVARAGKPLVTGATGPALEIVRREAAAAGAHLVELPRTGSARDHNVALAARAARSLCAALGHGIDDGAVARGLERRGLAGRTEIVQDAPRVILDGAHNADKIAVAIDAAIARATDGRRIAVLGLLAAKAAPQLVRPLAGRFDAVIATEPHAYAKRALPARETAALLRAVGVDASVEPDPRAALDAALSLAGRDGTVVVLGSFYLIGALRERWYAKRDVVLQRTSWPASA
jgi:dihydrofolate synthase / folylpolyglutamate synthase